MFTRHYVTAQNWTSERLERLAHEERGEIASWMIVLAMLVGAAAFAKDEIDGPLRDLIGDVKDALGG